jgi:hypothetical protein
MFDMYKILSLWRTDSGTLKTFCVSHSFTGVIFFSEAEACGAETRLKIKNINTGK